MKVIATSYIGSNGAFFNGKKIIETKQGDENFLKAIYSSLNLDYHKFHKIDNLSKMEILAEHLIHDAIPADIDLENDMQLIFANASSSQTTDLKYQESYLVQGNPSPSLFVYTLPNILTGELSIRNKWYGENIFFITESFKADFFIDQIQFSFKRGNSLCLCGWVESNLQGTEECFLFLVTEKQRNINPD